jgi:Epoxide hydrolase N terminus
MAVVNERSAGDTALRPFTIEVPEADLEELRARIAATRWPEKETVEDQSQGVPQGRPLRRLGRAGALLRGDPSRIQVTANHERRSS